MQLYRQTPQNQQLLPLEFPKWENPYKVTNIFAAVVDIQLSSCCIHEEKQKHVDSHKFILLNIKSTVVSKVYRFFMIQSCVADTHSVQ